MFNFPNIFPENNIIVRAVERVRAALLGERNIPSKESMELGFEELRNAEELLEKALKIGDRAVASNAAAKASSGQPDEDEKLNQAWCDLWAFEAAMAEAEKAHKFTPIKFTKTIK
jgi:hypothetical protein